MQIVIDIPDGLYRNVRDIPPTSFLSYCNDGTLHHAIYNGTVLPKGHGKLGDLDALEKYVIEKYSDGEQLAIDISEAPTVVAADTEVEK